MTQLWNDLARDAGIALSDEQQRKLHRYLDLLLEANQTMNLTRITERGAAEVQHVGDALTLLRHLPPGPHKLADVGSGGGVPGIPLAIARPDVAVTLIEATKKKAKFLREAAAALELANVRVSDARAEEAGNSPLRGSFEIVVARAVGQMVWLAEWCLPLVKSGGTVLAMKGLKAAEELAAARGAITLVGGGEPIFHPVSLPGSDHRVIIAIEKIKVTGKQFPRAASEAKGKSLR